MKSIPTIELPFISEPNNLIEQDGFLDCDNFTSPRVNSQNFMINIF